MKQIASQGKIIFIHDDASGKDFVFSTKHHGQTNPLFNRMPGSIKGDAESPTGEEWEAEQ